MVYWLLQRQLQRLLRLVLRRLLQLVLRMLLQRRRYVTQKAVCFAAKATNGCVRACVCVCARARVWTTERRANCSMLP